VRRGKPLWAALFAPLVGVFVGCESSRRAGAGDAQALADTLTSLIEDAYDFSKPDVVQRMTALYADTGRVVSASHGRMIASADSIRQGIATFWQVDGRNMRNPKWTWGDVYVDRLSPDAAVLTATWSIPHTTPNNQPHVLSGAWTAVFRRIDGLWIIVHEHLSEPPNEQP
jgi:ketosteroid isomerase-like protein